MPRPLPPAAARRCRCRCCCCCCCCCCKNFCLVFPVLVSTLSPDTAAFHCSNIVTPFVVSNSPVPPVALPAEAAAAAAAARIAATRGECKRRGEARRGEERRPRGDLINLGDLNFGELRRAGDFRRCGECRRAASAACASTASRPAAAASAASMIFERRVPAAAAAAATAGDSGRDFAASIDTDACKRSRKLGCPVVDGRSRQGVPGRIAFAHASCLRSSAPQKVQNFASSKGRRKPQFVFQQW